MRLLLDSFWRAAAYCLHPRVIALSLLPLVVIAALALGVGYFFWESTVVAMRAWLESWPVFGTVMGWMQGFGWGGVQGWVAPLLVIAAVIPLIVVVSLLLVATLMTPSMVALVSDRRFPALEKRHGGSWMGSVFGGLWATVVALVLLALSVPLWLIPPLVLVLPPLIWGWLTYRVMTYDVLADHASRAERDQLVREHRVTLLVLGVLTGYLGAAPSLIWAWGALAIPLAPVLIPVAVWVYTLVFAFSALWFTHYALAALQSLRGSQGAIQVVPPAPVRPYPGTVLLEPVAIPPQSDPSHAVNTLPPR